MGQIKILVVDDDVNLVQALVELLAQAGYQAASATSAEEALERCREETYHLVLTDLQLPARNGIALIKQLHETCPDTKTVLITAHGSIRSAVTALKRGAVEYMTKPLKPRRLLALIAALVADAPPYLSNKLLAGNKLEAVSFEGMHARSRAMQDVFERVRLAGQSDTTVLIVGESGTGKELVARAIHQRSSVAAGPFVPVHTGAIPQELIASELFGHEKGAFTGAVEKKPGRFELAEGGTLFLDEISTMDERTQVNLLRVLESFQYTRVGGKKEERANVRVVAASNRDLEAMVQAGELRQDLYYRLAIFTIKIPPLRERTEDIPLLAAELLREFATKYGKPVTTLPAETQRLLQAYPWPGNVRELRNVIEQAVLLARAADLSPLLLPQMLHRAPSRAEVIKIAIGTAMDAVEREVILRTLEANDGNKTATAEVLGISRRSIYNKLALYGLDSGGEPSHA
ncbi:MAG TPA: sigma-54 dependent transcriptional regulator [Polyangia bacterium]|nr:sigma-54 dependent transcriptional regulator [Polyangia bacterium]